MGTIDPTRDIEEMATLCRELLRSHAPDGLVFSAVETLVKAITNKPSSQPPPDQAIECLREVNIRFPDLDNVSITLLFSLYRRFQETQSHADYEDAISIVDADGSFTDPWSVKFASSMAVGIAQCRFYIYGNPEYLEEAISRIRVYLRTLSSEDPEHQEMTRDLE